MHRIYWVSHEAIFSRFVEMPNIGYRNTCSPRECIACSKFIGVLLAGYSILVIKDF